MSRLCKNNGLNDSCCPSPSLNCCDPCGACTYGSCSPYVVCGPCEPPLYGTSGCNSKPSNSRYCLPQCGLPDYPNCEVPVPLPAGADNCCVAPPLMEGGIPDPRVWDNCRPPSCYPCYLFN